MPVIGIDQVQREGVRPKWYSDFGYAAGGYHRANQDKLIDAILAAFTGGAYKGQQQTIPNPTYGQSTLPQLNPDVRLSQDQTPGFSLAPPQRPDLSRITTPAQPPIFPNRPMLSLQDIQNAQAMAGVQKTQRELDPSSPLNQFLLSQARQMSQGGTGSPSTPGQGFYEMGDVLERGGKRWRIVGFDADGTPLVAPD